MSGGFDAFGVVGKLECQCQRHIAFCISY